MLNGFLIDRVSIEIQENQFFKSHFTPVHGYMFRISFLMTLNIYKDYLRAVTVDASECNLMQMFFISI